MTARSPGPTNGCGAGERGAVSEGEAWPHATTKQTHAPSLVSLTIHATLAHSDAGCCGPWKNL